MNRHRTNFIFERRDIEAKDTGPFFQALPMRMDAGALRARAGTVLFKLAGYSGETREAYTVPEIRSFFRELEFSTDGAVAFFSDLRSPFLLVFAMCQLTNLTVLDSALHETVGLWIRAEELTAYLERTRGAISRLGTRAGLSQAKIRSKHRQLASYFQTAFPTLQVIKT